METTITITGPGGCIDNEIWAINRALLSLGYSVQIDNQYPPEKPFDDEKMESHVRKCNAREPMKVKIVADQQPWGG